MQPEIPAASLAWALVLGALLRLNGANRLEWLVRSADRAFGDDALAYFSERLDPAAIRHCLVSTLKLAKRNKVFDETAFIGLALDAPPRPLVHSVTRSRTRTAGSAAGCTSS